MNIGDHVVYVDAISRPNNALVTEVWRRPAGSDKPSVNVVFVSDVETEIDQYGRQIKRETSVPHESSQGAHGRFWREIQND
jgi:hypothetical protein